MSAEEASSLYLYLAKLQVELRSIDEHGLANLVNDRMAAVRNFMEPEDRKAADITIAGWRL